MHSEPISRREGLQLAGSALGAAFLTSSGRQASSQAAHSKLPIGMNLSGIADWQPGFPFVNLMWGARVWLTRDTSGQGPWTTNQMARIQLDENGYPLELPAVLDGGKRPQFVFTILPNTSKPGRYVVLYDGEGSLSFGGGSRLVNSRPGRIEITMRHAGGDAIEEIGIRTSVRGNHVRNIRIVPIEQEKRDLMQNPFLPEFLEFCQPWHCLRFMDWQITNRSTLKSWSERKRPGFYTQVGSDGDPDGIFGPPHESWQQKWAMGVTTETCLQLANLTRSDAWICIPHLADQDYIREQARLVKEQLDPQLKVYVEFSNEMWNWSFLQAQWMIRSELASDLVVSGGGKPPWRAGRKPDRFVNGIVAQGAGEGTDHPERTGALFRRCFAIWEDVFKGADRKRLVRVCAVQASWTDTVERTLGWVMRNGGCDALSPTGYFGPSEPIYKKWAAAGAALTADQVIADMRGAIQSEAKFVATNAAIAKKAGVRLVVYEGGQHIQPENQQIVPYNPALAAAQTHPEIYELMRLNMDLHARAGCELFCAFNSVGKQGARYGSWGHIEHYGEDPTRAPKYRAILEANVARRR
jgi:hypothetical protein